MSVIISPSTLNLEVAKTNDIKLLGFDAEEENLLVASATRRKEAELTIQVSKEREYLHRKEIIEDYFLRMSSVQKKQLFLKLIASVSPESVLHITNYVTAGHGKGFLYAKMDQDMTFVYDMPIRDHGRMLEEGTLQQTIQNDFEWFLTLESRHQEFLIIELIRRGGGHFKMAICAPLRYKYERAKKIIKAKRYNLSTPSLKKVHMTDDGTELGEEIYDPKDPATIEVEKQKKKWNDIITKLRREVEAIEKKLAPQMEKDNKKEKDSKKGSKSKSSSKKSSKKGGKDKKKEEEQLDVIQWFPVWIGKKILGFLDQKTLKKLKSVNSYWAYITKEVLDEMKIRKKLDKGMEKLKTEIDPVKLEEALAAKQVDEVKMPKRHGHITTNYADCAVIEEIVPRNLDYLVSRSLNAEVKNQIYAEEECMPKAVASFPRVITDDVLYRYIPCFLRDVNIALGIQGDVEKQKSFLTYTLSRLSSSLSISIDEQTLSEW